MIGYFLIALQMVGGFFKKTGFKIRQSFVSWLFRGEVRVPALKVGQNTISLSPGGADVVKWSASQAATALGEIGMDNATGKPSVFADDVGGGGASAKALCLEVDAIIKDGSTAFTGNQPMGGNKLTGLGDGSTGTQDSCSVAQMEDYVAANLGETVSKANVDASTTAALPANTRTGDVLTADANGAFPTIDDVAAALNQDYLVKNEGGGASHINNGIYRLTTLGDAGTPWELTRRADLANGDSAAGIFCSAEQGTVNGDKTFRCINNTGSDVVNTDALELKFWGQLTDHGNLIGLNDDDHTQYARLAGRSGGQTIQGGTDAGDHITVESTSNATKGSWRVASGTNMQMLGDDDFVPAVDGEGEIGTNANRFKSVRAVTVQSGDHDFVSKKRDAHWTFTEEHNRMLAYNRKTGKCYSLMMFPCRKPDHIQ